MIRLDDTLRLAMTKRRTRKIRTGFTVAIAGLLFGVLMFALFVYGGVTNSTNAMLEASMSSRYIIGGTKAWQQVDYNGALNNQDTVAQAIKERSTLIEDKKREAKRLGISYDPSTEPMAYETVDGNKQLSYGSIYGQRAIREAEQRDNPTRTLADFKKFADKYQPTTYYEVKVLAPNGAMTEMKQGKENFDAAGSQQQNPSEQPDFQSMTVAPKGLLSSYLFSNYKWNPASGRVPVVVSQKRAALLTGMTTPKADTPAEKALTYTKDLRAKVNGMTFDVCYRNARSSELVQQVLRTDKEIAAQANNKEYQAPALQYKLPDETSCGPVEVKQDKRTAEQKKYDAAVEEFDRKFNSFVDPMQRKITYEVVGVSPGSMNDFYSGGGAMDGSGMLMMMLGSYAFSFATPQELYEQIPADKSIDAVFEGTSPENPFMAFVSGGTFFAEFNDAARAREFAKKETCEWGNTGCAPRDKWFRLDPFGSNSLALEDAQKTAGQALFWLGVAVAVIASIIAGLTIGRTIADGRRETAVFRAIGFKRLDITQIYVTYGLLLCIDIALFALAAGLIGALVLDNFFWLPATVSGRLALGLYDSPLTFHFIGLTYYHLYAIAAVFAAGVAGMIVPLLRNVRRSPIRDMRDE